MPTSNRLTSLFRVPALALALVAGAGLTSPALAQSSESAASEAAKTVLSVGDKAPKFQVESFLKGEPISGFEPGKVYVVEFWATWCGPCIRMFPHLSEKQKEWGDKVTVLGVNIWERDKDRDDNPIPYDQILAKVTDFVAKQGDKMSYRVAFDGAAKHMTNAWMRAANRNYIPHAFVVDQTGTIAWIGHPAGMDDVVAQVLAKTWDMDKAKAQHAEALRQEAEQAKADEAQENEAKAVMPLMQEARKLWQDGKKDDAVGKMMEIAEKAPNAGMGAADQALRYLLTEKKDFARAYAFAGKMVDGPYATNPMGLNMIAWHIVDPEASVETKNLDIAMRAATKANDLTGNKDASILDTLARVHWEKGDKAKAIEAQERAVANAPSEMKGELQKTLDQFKGN